VRARASAEALASEHIELDELATSPSFKRGMRDVDQHCREEHLHRSLWNSISATTPRRPWRERQGARGASVAWRQSEETHVQMDSWGMTHE